MSISILQRLRTPTHGNLAAWAVLAVLLLAVEAWAGVHSLDMEAHAGGEPCKICLGAASFGSAAPAHTPALLVERARPALATGREYAVEHTAPPRQVARGPPFVS